MPEGGGHWELSWKLATTQSTVNAPFMLYTTKKEKNVDNYDNIKSKPFLYQRPLFKNEKGKPGLGGHLYTNHLCILTRNTVCPVKNSKN